MLGTTEQMDRALSMYQAVTARETPSLLWLTWQRCVGEVCSLRVYCRASVRPVRTRKFQESALSLRQISQRTRNLKLTHEMSASWMLTRSTKEPELRYFVSYEVDERRTSMQYLHETETSSAGVTYESGSRAGSQPNDDGEQTRILRTDGAIVLRLSVGYSSYTARKQCLPNRCSCNSPLAKPMLWTPNSVPNTPAERCVHFVKCLFPDDEINGVSQCLSHKARLCRERLLDESFRQASALGRYTLCRSLHRVLLCNFSPHGYEE